MADKLRCKNEECESHKDDQHLFAVDGVEVDEDGDLVENLKKLDADAFRCSFCGGEVAMVAVG
jgi:hypothetical protein